MLLVKAGKLIQGRRSRAFREDPCCNPSDKAGRAEVKAKLMKAVNIWGVSENRGT